VTSRVPGRILEPVETTLPNGLRVALSRDATIPGISLNLTILSGARIDREDRAGVAVMASRLLDEGTTTRSSLEIAEAIESVGGSIDCDSSTDRTTIHLSVLRQDIGLGLDLVADIVADPLFSEEAVENERERMLAEIQSAMDRPQVVAGWEFNELVYRDHPLHRPVHGYPETIRQIERSDLVAHHRASFDPANSLLSVAGDFRAEDLVGALERAFSTWRCDPVPLPAMLAPLRQTEMRESFLRLPTQQAHVYLGHLGIDRRDPDFYTLQVLDTILGGGAGLTSRIPRKLRDEQGLAYTTFAGISMSAGRDPGKFVAYIGTSPENVDRAIQGLTEEIDRMVAEEVAQEELEDAKAYLTGSFVFGFESNAQVARFLTNARIFDLGFDYIRRYPGIISAVGASDVREAARRHLDTSRCSLVVAGPEEARPRGVTEHLEHREP
jgi:zinc protease